MKEQGNIQVFLNDIDPHYHLEVEELHQTLQNLGCTIGLQQAKSGHVVSYNHPVSKKVVANLVTRKTGPVIRIYADHAVGDQELLDAMPDKLRQKVKKASACRRMLDPTKCNARCPMGYDFLLDGERQQKCRYNSFLLPILAENLPWFQWVLRREMELRNSANPV